MSQRTKSGLSCFGTYGGPSAPNLIFGKNSSSYYAANSLMMTILVTQRTEPEIQRAELWEKEFLKFCKEYREKSSKITFSFMAERSIAVSLTSEQPNLNCLISGRSWERCQRRNRDSCHCAGFSFRIRHFLPWSLLRLWKPAVVYFGPLSSLPWNAQRHHQSAQFFLFMGGFLNVWNPSRQKCACCAILRCHTSRSLPHIHGCQVLRTNTSFDAVHDSWKVSGSRGSGDGRNHASHVQ